MSTGKRFEFLDSSKYYHVLIYRFWIILLVSMLEVELEHTQEWRTVKVRISVNYVDLRLSFLESYNVSRG